MRLPAPFASGRTAEVFDYGDGLVLKLFRAGTPLPEIEHEAEIAGLLQNTDLPIPRYAGMRQIGERHGLLYEKIEGILLGQFLLNAPNRPEADARIIASLQARIHGQQAPAGLPSLKQRLKERILRQKSLPVPVRQQLLDHLQALPEGDSLCHGDLHPFNIILHANGPVAIDWHDASSGNPMADVARTTLLLLGAIHRNTTCGQRRIRFMQRLHAAYLNHYCRLSPQHRHEHRYWLPIVAAARLAEHIHGTDDWLISVAAVGLALPDYTCAA